MLPCPKQKKTENVSLSFNTGCVNGFLFQYFPGCSVAFLHFVHPVVGLGKPLGQCYTGVWRAYAISVAGAYIIWLF